MTLSDENPGYDPNDPTRDLSAWYEVGKSDGRQEREGMFPAWAHEKVQQAWRTGYRTSVAEDIDYDPFN